MSDTINQRISDRLIRRQIQVGRVEISLRREVYAQLALLEREILVVLTSNDPTEFVLLARRRREIEQLMHDEIDPLIQERYRHIASLLDVAMMRIGKSEAEAVQTIVND